MASIRTISATAPIPNVPSEVMPTGASHRVGRRLWNLLFISRDGIVGVRQKQAHFVETFVSLPWRAAFRAKALEAAVLDYFKRVCCRCAFSINRRVRHCPSGHYW
jgi:hypothetical protein